MAEERKETFQLHKELTCLTNLQEIARAKEAIRKDGRRRLVEKWQTTNGDQFGRWTHRLIPELATWLNRKHGQVGFYLAQALSCHGCFNAYLKRFKKKEMSRVATADPLWKMQNTHSLPMPGGVQKGRLSVEEWAQNSLRTRWSFSRSSLNRYGCLSSHSSPSCCRRGSSMGVESAATTRASRNRIEACIRGPASWADSAVRDDQERNIFIPPLVCVASQPD